MSVQSIFDFLVHGHKKIRVLCHAATKLFEARMQLFGPLIYTNLYKKKMIKYYIFDFGVSIILIFILICSGPHVGYD